MKISVIILLAFAMIAGCFACRKDHDNKPTQGIEGKWTGTYINDASGNTFYYSFQFKPGGVMQEINSSGTVIGEGTWEFSGNVLTGHYTWLAPGSSSYTIVGAYYPATGKILGNWGYGNSATDGGTWEMNKQ